MKENKAVLSQFNWTFLDSGSSSGKVNMEQDKKLLDEIKPGAAVLRLYGWNPYCISLGYNQTAEILDLEKLYKAGIDYINRPTGGKAVLHAEELTYAVILSPLQKTMPGIFYEEINKAIVAGISGYDPRLRECRLEEQQPDLREAGNLPQGAACFSVPAKSELKFRGKKICGSAQRYIRGNILQHGSLLTGNFHLSLPDYMKGSIAVCERIKNSLMASSNDLKSILGENINLNRLRDEVFEGFERYTGIRAGKVQFEEVTE